MTSDPLQNMFSDIKKILEFTEFKDEVRAKEAETVESANMAELWMNANVEADSFLTYRFMWTIAMFQNLFPSVPLTTIQNYLDNPRIIPITYQDAIREKGREMFLESYEEQNNYYRMLNGLPPIDEDPANFIYPSEPIRNQLHIDGSIPVHELSVLVQNNFMATTEYERVLAENPEKEYLKYLGSYKIEPYSARLAKDFDIIRYPIGRSDINPNLLTSFSNLYDDYREYVMVTLYNTSLESVYAGYRSFMGFLILACTLLQINNRALEALHDKRYLDDSALYMVLSMYGISDKLMLPTDVRRNLAINMVKLVKKKATDEVYYDLIDILGYQDVTVSKLMLMKGQQFEGANKTATDESKPYFIQIDLKDQNPYDTITEGKAPIYSYEEITGNDPMWWNTQDVQDILHNRIYSESDTKYISVSAAVNQMEYLMESIYFPKMVLDNPATSSNIMISIPEMFGTKSHSLYDLIIMILCANCMMHGMSGKIQSDEYLYPMEEWTQSEIGSATIMGEFREKLFASAGFNFDMDMDSFIEFLDSTKYVDKTRVMNFMKNLNIESESDISYIYNNIIIPMREWLEDQIATSDNRYQYNEYEGIYRALFSYDATRNKFLDDFKTPIELIMDQYGVSEDDMIAFMHFYPRNIDGTKVTINEFNAGHNTSRYRYPFLSLSNPIDWNIHIIVDDPPYGEDDRGILYFHDILNSSDIREITNEDGTRIFMDYISNEEGWVLNQKAVDEAIRMLSALDDDMLADAYFQVSTANTMYPGAFDKGQRLPTDIRNGLYKTILIEKVRMDCNGLADPPKTYFELLSRNNSELYDVLMKDNMFERDRQTWINNIMTIITVIESELSMHLKYFEQSILGEDLFFKPLITLIKHFKSTLVDFAKTGLKYQFADKIDSGGSSNMFKLFDEVAFIINFITMSNNAYDTVFGLYDAIFNTKYNIIMSDYYETYTTLVGYGFAAEQQTTSMGSIKLTDEMKFFINGTEFDPDGQPSYWISGEANSGRWSDDMEYLIAARKEHAKIAGIQYDTEGWKDFVESYNPGAW